LRTGLISVSHGGCNLRPTFFAGRATSMTMPRNSKGYHYQPYQRQRPVSCHFCRTRKLRCNRESPCSNCTARDITCHLYALESQHGAFNKLGITEGRNLPRSHDEPSRPILERLERLEQALLNNTSTTSTSAQSVNAPAFRMPVNPTPVEIGIRADGLRNEPQPATDAEILERECVDQCCEVRGYRVSLSPPQMASFICIMLPRRPLKQDRHKC